MRTGSTNVFDAPLGDGYTVKSMEREANATVKFGKHVNSTNEAKILMLATEGDM
eukprot:CAMPEP_0170479808 /NCGR_PEP_ID=MMETSP0208-20121228/898_1 /TAXON_ID=197538 /ORGANISM="Strombidium inclinatum, Strain S3" /LENGTH=53 /DNA_ID=CAMNT_0010752265 /DNA_START=137 /DNA_END=298 /DNA_ORIENTATION=+